MTEGGVRVPAFIHSPLLPITGKVSDSMVHVSDWYPTFLRLAGESAEAVSALELDGVDQYDTFFSADATGDETYVDKLSHIFMNHG